MNLPFSSSIEILIFPNQTRNVGHKYPPSEYFKLIRNTNLGQWQVQMIKPIDRDVSAVFFVSVKQTPSKKQPKTPLPPKHPKYFGTGEKTNLKMSPVIKALHVRFYWLTFCYYKPVYCCLRNGGKKVFCNEIALFTAICCILKQI